MQHVSSIEEHVRAPYSRLCLLFEIVFIIHWHDPDGLTRGCVSPCSRVGRGTVTDLGGYKQGRQLNTMRRHIIQKHLWNSNCLAGQRAGQSQASLLVLEGCARTHVPTLHTPGEPREAKRQPVKDASWDSQLYRHDRDAERRACQIYIGVAPWPVSGFCCLHKITQLIMHPTYLDNDVGRCLRHDFIGLLPTGDFLGWGLRLHVTEV